MIKYTACHWINWLSATYEGKQEKKKKRQLGGKTVECKISEGKFCKCVVWVPLYISAFAQNYLCACVRGRNAASTCG